VIHAPSIQTLPLGADGPLREATEAVIARPPDVLVANTGLGIRSWLGAADSWELGADLRRALQHAEIYARGPKASGAVHSAGLEVAARAPTERLNEAVSLALEGRAPGSTVALQVDGSGETPEIDRLRDAGMDVVVVPVYTWKLPADHRPAVRLAEAVIAGRVHAVTFTAGPAVRNWFAIAAEEGIDGELRTALDERDIVVGCVGPVCADSALIEGVDPARIAIPAASRLGPLVRIVADRLVARTHAIRIGGSDLVLAGEAALIDGNTISLSGIEARLLATLAAEPNVVFTKEQLLKSVWAGATDDPHAVEVAVARLRRRLGAAGKSITSVHRRGYALRTGD
jgi:uroporphyrinogen-III synthase